MTKSFAGAALLILRDRGLLALSDLATKYVPELRSDKRWDEITIYDLATMRSGLPEDNPWGDRQLECNDSEYSEIFDGSRGGFNFCALKGTRQIYSNLSYMLIGRIISSVSKVHALAFISNEILSPLGMSSTLWSTNNSSLHFSVGLDSLNTSIPPPCSNGDGAVFGGLLSSVNDMLIWLDFLMSRSHPIYDQLLKSTSRHELRSGSWLFEEYDNPRDVICYAYGLGANYLPTVKLLSFGHSGGLPGFGSRMVFIPDYQIGVVALSNLTYANVGEPCQHFLEDIVKVLPAPSNPNLALIEKRFQELLNVIRLWNNNQSLDLFSSNFFLDNSKDEIALKFKKLQIRFLNALPILKVEIGLHALVLQGEEKILRFSLAPVEDAKIQMIDFF